MELYFYIIFVIVFGGYLIWAVRSTLKSHETSKVKRCIILFFIGPVVIEVLSTGLAVVIALVLSVVGFCFLVSIFS